MVNCVEYGFEQGFEKIVGALEGVLERPVLAAVYGWLGSGKSYLIERIAAEFKRRGLYVADQGGGPTPDTFENIKRRGDGNWVDMYLFHCAWDRSDLGFLDMGDKKEDPNYLAEKILGRKLNLNIGIYDPRIEGIRLNGDYDLIISNPDTKRRGACFTV